MKNPCTYVLGLLMLFHFVSFWSVWIIATEIIIFGNFSSQYRSSIFLNAQCTLSFDSLLKLVELYPKNYQIWRFISAQVDDELIIKLIEFALGKDSKNYHAWEALVERPSLLQHGIQLATRLIREDRDNNSANSYLKEFNDV